jgi:hypothetical protein
MSAADLSLPAGPARPRPAWTITYRGLVHAVFAAFIFCGSISLVEPSPYDFLFIVLFPMWFIGGFKLPKVILPVIVLWIVYDVAGFIALMPHLGDPDSVKFQLQSLYLILTVVFFSIFFSDRTEQRLTLCLKAYTGGAILCSAIGLAGWFNVEGLQKYTTMDMGRLSSTFKDANVLGSYLILSALHLSQGLALGRFKRVAPALIGAVMVFLNIFFSFSRGSWGATVVALTMLTGMSYATAGSRRDRRRIALVAAVVLGLIVLIVGVALIIPSTRNMLLLRASLLQSYDVGEEGRFGNQLRSLPMLLELPNGFGPLRFRLVFGLEPHNSYINAFASYGWIGGFAWFIIVGMTMWVGFRLCFARSPYRSLMQVYWPALFVLLMQGFQIDIDHWRQLFLCFGAVWGAEAARLKWLRGERRQLEASRTPALAAEREPSSHLRIGVSNQR